MKKKLVLGILTAAILTLTGCTGLDEFRNSSSKKSPMSQERVAASVDVNEEIFGVGSASIEESGRGVAKMRASKEARDDIKNKLLKESDTVLQSYLGQIDFYDRKVSKSVRGDLSEYITNNMLSDTVEKDSWVENGRVYTVIAIEKSEIPLRSRETFVGHVDDIIKRLTEIKEELIAIPLEGSSYTAEPLETSEGSPSDLQMTEVEEVKEIEEKVLEIDHINTEEDVIDIQL